MARCAWMTRRSSTTNGTELIVYTCQDSANQKWSLP